jgi:very-short-patch-repair endonuclease
MTDDTMPDRLMDAAQELLAEMIDEAIDRTGDKEKYGSPIERALAVAFVLQQRVRFPEIGFLPTHGITEISARTKMAGFETHPRGHQRILGCVFPQVVIDPYRVDFLVLHECGLKGIGGIVVECDGHAFHERTKEQAARDKSRDRDLQERGYRVFRFTGSEIFANMYDCAHSVLESALGQAVDAIHARSLLAAGDYNGAIRQVTRPERSVFAEVPF